MSVRLNVFPRGRHVGVVSGGSDNLTFQYNPLIVEEYPPNAIVLSLSLPVTGDEIGGHEVLRYFDGVLPLEAQRRGLADKHHLESSDALGFLSVLGADLHGALRILPANLVPDREPAPKHIGKRLKEMDLPRLLVAEEWALRVARAAGLPAADAYLVSNEELAVTRFDYPTTRLTAIGSIRKTFAKP